MKAVLECVLAFFSAILAFPVLILFVEAVFATARRSPPVRLNSMRPRLAVLVPAHDESNGLIPTLRSVLPQLNAADRCLVIADNCTDDTARIASAEGAEVAERHAAERRGKGYALDFGLQLLVGDPVEVVIVVDADCIVAPGAIDLITRLAYATGRPVQALYLTKAPADARRMATIGEFAWRIKNWARALGLKRMGLPCQLMGTGMAFPWAAIRAIDLASGHLVEDVKMGIDLARLGKPALFCPDALVTSVFPSNEIGAKSQRTRWEHGHLGMIANDVPSLLLEGLAKRSVALIALALDLMVPPLALLVMLVVALLALSAVAAALGVGAVPLWLMVTTTGLLIAAITLFWLRFGTDVVSISTLALAGVYALRKIPVYLQFLAARQTEWVKSKRDAQ